MEIAAALTQYAREENLTDTQIGAAVGVSSWSIMTWRTGAAIPRGQHLLALVKTYPRFAALLGLAVV